MSELMSNFMDSPLVVWVSHKDMMAPAVCAEFVLALSVVCLAAASDSANLSNTNVGWMLYVCLKPSGKRLI